MTRYVRLSPTLVVNPELIAAVLAEPGPYHYMDWAIFLVPVMAAARAQWLQVEEVRRVVIGTEVKMIEWQGQPQEQTQYIREDDDLYALRVRQHVDAITAKLWPEGDPHVP